MGYKLRKCLHNGEWYYFLHEVGETERKYYAMVMESPNLQNLIEDVEAMREALQQPAEVFEMPDEPPF